MVGELVKLGELLKLGLTVGLKVGLKAGLKVSVGEKLWSPPRSELSLVLVPVTLPWV